LIRAVIFDIDGTLVDSVDLHARAWQEALAHFGHTVEFAAVRRQIGKGGDQLLPVFVSQEELARRGKEIEAYRSQLFKARYLPQVRAFPAVRQLFECISANGQRITLASSAKADELTAYKKIADIEDLVDEETSADDVERSKPHPDIFAASLGKLGDVDATEALVVGDSPYDAEAAGKIGLRSIGLLCGGFPEEDLRKAGCITIYRNPADLLMHFDQSPLGVGAPRPKPSRFVEHSLILALGLAVATGIALLAYRAVPERSQPRMGWRKTRVMRKTTWPGRWTS
jgi:HAD superfamily hydrolase (TIGR01509 family)